MKYQIFITILLSTLALSVFAMKMKAKADIDPCHGGTDKTCSGLKGKDGKSAGCKWGKVGKATTDSCSTKAVEAKKADAPKPTTPSTSAPTTAASFAETDSETEDEKTKKCVAHKKNEVACLADRNCSFKTTCLFDVKKSKKASFAETDSETEDEKTKKCVAHKKNEVACLADRNCSFKTTCLFDVKKSKKTSFVEAETDSEAPKKSALPKAVSKVKVACNATKKGDCNKDSCSWDAKTNKCSEKTATPPRPKKEAPKTVPAKVAATTSL